MDKKDKIQNYMESLEQNNSQVVINGVSVMIQFFFVDSLRPFCS